MRDSGFQHILADRFFAFKSRHLRNITKISSQNAGAPARNPRNIQTIEKNCAGGRIQPSAHQLEHGAFSRTAAARHKKKIPLLNRQGKVLDSRNFSPVLPVISCDSV